jgi:predicted dehydrogenase
VSDSNLTRRAFIAATTTTLAAATTRVNAAEVVPGKTSPNEKLNIAAIGIGGMGKGNIQACEDENIVALCDVDSQHAAPVFEKYPNASRYADFRKMFDKEADNIDAVIVATPDHTHAVIGIAAMRLKKHLYCQKPLAHSLHEVRLMTETAREYGVQTQMGNQGHSSNAIRRLCEWVWDGAIGPIREVHAWSDRPVGGDPWSDFPLDGRPSETPPVPDHLDWDLWLGPAPERPYHPIYHPLTWRGFIDFGTGPLGDMGCHILDPAFWALKLGHPTTVQATNTHTDPAIAAETYPRACIVRYDFPEREGMPPVKLTWYDGRLLPPVPPGMDPRFEFGSNGALYVGDDGYIIHGSHGAGAVRILPRAKARAYEMPEPTIPRVAEGSGAHERDWLRACKDGNPASSNFEYGGPLTEMVLLGVLAIRQPNKRLEWDGPSQTITNDEDANALVNPPVRAGWEL